MFNRKKLVALISLLLIIALWLSASREAAAEQAEEINQNMNILKSTDSSPADRRNAVKRLVKIGIPAVPILIKAIEDDNPIVRLNAVVALTAIGPGAKEAVPSLIEALANRNSYVRENAAIALGSIGAAAKEAVPNLTKALQEDNSEVKVAAAWALGQLGQEGLEAVPDLIKALQARNH